LASLRGSSNPSFRSLGFGAPDALHIYEREIRDSGAVEEPHLGARSRPDAETAVRNRRSSVTCTCVILSASLMERGEALFQQPHSHLSGPLFSQAMSRRGTAAFQIADWPKGRHRMVSLVETMLKLHNSGYSTEDHIVDISNMVGLVETMKKLQGDNSRLAADGLRPGRGSGS